MRTLLMLGFLAALTVAAFLGYSLSTGTFRSVTDPLIQLVPSLQAAIQSGSVDRTEWTDVNGRTAQMRLLEVREVNGTHVDVFVMAGRAEPFEYALDRLCEDDRAYIANHLEQFTPAAAGPGEAIVGEPRTIAAESDEPRDSTLFEARVRRDLVTQQDDRFERLSGLDFKPVDYYLVYFASRNCRGSRGFTPRLMSDYAHLKDTSHSFEVIFVSCDQTQQQMKLHMSDFNMAWPALDYTQTQDSYNVLTRFNEEVGTPCLVLLDKDGNVLAHSKDSPNTYVGPRKVLEQFQKMLLNDV